MTAIEEPESVRGGAPAFLQLFGEREPRGTVELDGLVDGWATRIRQPDLVVEVLVTDAFEDDHLHRVPPRPVRFGC